MHMKRVGYVRQVWRLVRHVDDDLRDGDGLVLWEPAVVGVGRDGANLVLLNVHGGPWGGLQGPERITPKYSKAKPALVLL